VIGRPFEQRSICYSTSLSAFVSLCVASPCTSVPRLTAGVTFFEPIGSRLTSGARLKDSDKSRSSWYSSTRYRTMRSTDR
jgi:hypothetical protein